MDAETRQAIQTQYPAFSYLLDEPEIGPLLEQAINEGWPEGRFISALYATNWYRMRSETTRQMETLRQLDPTQFQQLANQTYNDIKDWAGQLGIQFDEYELQYMTQQTMYSGGKAGDATGRIGWLNFVRANPQKVSHTGSIYANAQLAEAIHRNEFFFAPKWDDMIRAGAEIALGYNTEQGYRETLSEWFGAINPHLAPRLKGGETLAQIINPFRDLIAKELELGGMEDVDMISSNEWRWLLGVPQDATQGNQSTMRLPTQQEVISGARKDPRWKKTIGATALSTNLVTEMTRKMGMTT